MSVKRTQWQETKPEGRCQCHACGDAEGQSQNCGCRHSSAPFLLVWRLPKQRKDFRDGHHVLELFGAINGCNAKQTIAIAVKYPMRSAAIVISGITLAPVWNDAARTGEKMRPASPTDWAEIELFPAPRSCAQYQTRQRSLTSS
jgi:hypothetical protein